VRGLIDQNANRILDRNEKWDTVSVPVQTRSPIVELDAIERDTTPAFFENVIAVDSVTLRLTFDKPLDPGIQLQPAIFRVQRADSSELEIVRVQWQSAYDQARQAQVADSLKRADTARVQPAVPLPGPFRPTDARATRTAAQAQGPPAGKTIVSRLRQHSGAAHARCSWSLRAPRGTCSAVEGVTRGYHSQSRHRRTTTKATRDRYDAARATAAATALIDR
jgi:hypothetical protein